MPISVLIAHDFVLSTALEAAWMDELPLARRTQIARWPSARARHRSLIASRLLREGLRQFGHRGAVLSSLHYTAHGRPALDLPVDFSISHCEGRVVCAVSTDGSIGVDVEAIGTLTGDDFPRYLNDGERAWAGRDPRRFCAVWTRKEAVAKAAGADSLDKLRDIDTRPAGEDAAFAGQLWQTSALDMGSAHVAHLAFRNRCATRVSSAWLELDLCIDRA
ncbi:4'-phosphopantetheinyl transferase superfamily protein [Diaphorobacter sp. JS3050]|uniref:4'-phosphopantetheinyl transferase family protein n=1 Tax=Diaphorobacter sp. JS3050 TaxID=2735554 RepID=UPI00155487FB|nr:4'-phosphopantetheinyl transferase superfamily protein [Diaphorobacter sp. JS3050]QJY33870.1 4'-phosphopantetheinyl transferase superfamily protein [Diaphorobacter sp. JS3050]